MRGVPPRRRPAGRAWPRSKRFRTARRCPRASGEGAGRGNAGEAEAGDDRAPAAVRRGGRVEAEHAAGADQQRPGDAGDESREPCPRGRSGGGNGADDDDLGEAGQYLKDFRDDQHRHRAREGSIGGAGAQVPPARAAEHRHQHGAGSEHRHAKHDQRNGRRASARIGTDHGSKLSCARLQACMAETPAPGTKLFGSRLGCGAWRRPGVTFCRGACAAHPRLAP
jgi:hypothetical protein